MLWTYNIIQYFRGWVFFFFLLSIVESIKVRAHLQIVEGMTPSTWNSFSSSHKRTLWVYNHRRRHDPRNQILL
jgi:hypothetical protein